MPESLISVALPRFLLDEHRLQIEAAAGTRARLLADNDPVLLDGEPRDLEVVVTGIDDALLDFLVALPTVRWVHSVSAGVEHLPLETMADRSIILTNSAGAYAPAMAEYALAGAIMLLRKLPSLLDGQRERRWLNGESHDGNVLRGKHLGIVGYGAVGRHLANAARAMGMTIWATRRSAMIPSGEPLDRLLLAENLPELLIESDVVVLAASLNQSTRHFIGEEELAVMKPNAVLINVARGGLVDEPALARALRDGKIRGAMLDVTDTEPLPAESELWGIPNLIITPHISGNTPESWDWAVEFFCKNLRLYVTGSPERMGNLVDYNAVR